MTSWWMEPSPPREGFTAMAAKQLNTPVPIDETAGESEMQIIVRRQQVLSALIGLQQGKRTDGIRHANVVGN